MQHGGKRGRQERGGSGKPSKKRYLHKPPAGGNKLGIPMQSRGIMISCTSSKEQQAAREAIALFTESYEQLGGTWTQQAGPAAADAAADAPPTDIDAALASEVAELRGGSRQSFYYHQLGIHSVVFLECKDGGGPGPAALVQHACQRVSDSQQGAGRFCSRFYPVERTCYASMEKIEELAAQVVRDHFPADAQEPIEFAVVYDARAAPPLDRMEVINAFATRVPAPHKVNLGAPHKAILVNVVKGVCGVAVVERFKELCRYNIRTLALPEEEREAQREAQRQQSKAEAAPAAAAAPPVEEGQAAEAADAAAAGGVTAQQQAGAEQQEQQEQQAAGQQEEEEPQAAA